MSITNSVATMLFGAMVISLVLWAGARRQVVPGRLQAFGEIVYDLIDKGLTGPMIGDRGRPFLPYVFALFCMIAVWNIWGIVPGQFTVTSQLAVTVTLAVITFVMVIVVGFVRNGLGFFKLFVPSGIHWVMLILIVPIEVISFLVRPVTLSMRLFGNMIGGHVVLYMFGSFVVGMAVWAWHLGGARLSRLARLRAVARHGDRAFGARTDRRLPAGVRLRRADLHLPFRRREPRSRPLTQPS